MSERLTGLTTSCILRHNEGYRISTMSRHTLNDGRTPHPVITTKSYDLWMKEVAPPDALVASWYSKNANNKIDWEHFEKYYRLYLQLPRQQEAIQEIIALAKEKLVTLMCIEEAPEFCH